MLILKWARRIPMGQGRGLKTQFITLWLLLGFIPVYVSIRQGR